MCKDCGCGKAPAKNIEHEHAHTHGSHTHSHAHSHGNEEHNHDHENDHGHGHSHATVLTLEQKVLAKNDQAAQALREEFARRKLVVLNLISSPGSGKTALLERTLEQLSPSLCCAVITGDQQTDNDARRLSGKGGRVCQIETGNSCHLDASQVHDSLWRVLSPETKVLFIENVGNLICPAAFDLGEQMKIALLSVTEGEDKPLKYPVVFSQASLVLVTKMDLAPHSEWNRSACLENIGRVNPHATVIELSSKSGEGMDKWLRFLKDRAADIASGN